MTKAVSGLHQSIFATGCLLASCLAATPAHAASDSGVSTIEEVVVTARRREESMQEVPVAVTALSGDYLLKHSITRLEDVQYHAPTLTITPNESKRSLPTFGIRGQRQTSTVITQDQSVGVYVAEVYQARPHGINQSLYDMESIQVLKGPQGTLFGRNTTGGAILFTPNKPTDQLEGEVAVGGTAFDGGNGGSVEGMFNVPLSDRVMLRAAGKLARREGFVENFGPNGIDDLNDEHADSWRVSLLAQLTDSVDTYFLYDHYKTNENGTATILNYLDPNSGRVALYGSTLTDAFARQQARDYQTTEINLEGVFSKYEVWGVSNTTTWSTGAVTVKNILAYRSILEDDRVDYDGTLVPYVESKTKIADFDQISNEFQIQGTAFDDQLDWVTGAFWFKEDGDDLGTSYIFVPFNPANGAVPPGTSYLEGAGNTSGGYGKNVSYSVYAQVTTPLTFAEDLSLTAGLRYNWDERTFISESRNALGCRIQDEDGAPLPLDQCSKKVKEDFSAPTWTVSLDYRVNDDTLVYLAHRRGYRAGGFNVRGESAAQFEPFDEETVSDIELGLKADWQLGEVPARTNVAIYYQDYKDIQRSVTQVTSSGALANSIFNAAAATIWGGEIEATLFLTDNLELSGFYALVDASYDDFEDANGNDFSDNDLQYVPKHTYAATLRYSVPMGTGGELAFQANYYHQSKVFFSDLDQGPAFGPFDAQGQDSYGLLNFQVDWTEIMGSAFDASFYVKNATDEEYALHGSVFAGSLGFNQMTIGDPRLYGLTVRYRFGER